MWWLLMNGSCHRLVNRFPYINVGAGRAGVRSRRPTIQWRDLYFIISLNSFWKLISVYIISQHKAFRCRRKSYGNNAFAVYLLSDVFIWSRSTTQRLSVFRLPPRHANTFAHSFSCGSGEGRQSNRLQMLLQHKTLKPVHDDPCWEYTRSFVRPLRR